MSSKKSSHSPKAASFEVRPVSARPLKSALDTLRPFLSGCHGLDLFCGLGRFGLGALKEGANEVIFVDTAEAHLETVKRAGAAFGSAARLVRDDAFRFLSRSDERFDIVFADPPFPLWVDGFETRLFEAVLPRLAPTAIFLVKHPAAMIVSGVGLAHWKTSRFGESALSYFNDGD